MDVSFLIYILKVIVQIAAISFICYKFYDVFHGSKTPVTFYVFCVYGFFLLAAHYLDLSVIESILKNLFTPFLIMLIIVFRDDFKEDIINNQKSISMRFTRKKEGYVSSGDLNSILMSLYSLADMKRGALVVIQRKDELMTKLKSTPTPLNCDIESDIITTIFSYDTPLHDGAIIIDRDKILCARCVLPTSKQGSIKPSQLVNLDEQEDISVSNLTLEGRRDPRREDKIFGTRHRAALGITEITDAIAIVVSEETKALSICFDHNIYYDLGMEDALMLLNQMIGYEDKKD